MARTDNTAIDTYRADPLRWVADTCEALGLNPGLDTAITVSAAYLGDDPDRFRVDSVQLEIRWKLLGREARRAVKLFCKLEVPEWALGGTYKEPPLFGQKVYGERGNELTVSLQVGGAYVCEQVGEQDSSPSEYEKERARKLAAMTPEEVMAEHTKRIEELVATSTKPSYRCRPA